MSKASSSRMYFKELKSLKGGSPQNAGELHVSFDGSDKTLRAPLAGADRSNGGRVLAGYYFDEIGDGLLFYVPGDFIDQQIVLPHSSVYVSFGETDTGWDAKHGYIILKKADEPGRYDVKFDCSAEEGSPRQAKGIGYVVFGEDEK
ncbi:hypothetical protein [Pseudomonas moraviensis]|uniref:Uncharacterized protein n=1 Tax=Pseudomonas moraviensis TaxID=321662 RepID=A0A7Y9VUZ5_9PSED|nr:hypothetical protein [Pseudomonas moraviensis]NYH09044.1 hypothetical protein [Pseudomonas moraviensis]